MTALPQAFLNRCTELSIDQTESVLCVSIAEQKLHWFKNRELHQALICSTSKFGIGQEEGSNCTPLGLHAIREKIGADEPIGTVFKGRVVVGRDGINNPAARITTRILWLEGLEDGFNRGGNVDTHERYVYIHGTGDESKLGQPDSHGCVHLKAEDLVALFDDVPAGTLVWIQR